MIDCEQYTRDNDTVHCVEISNNVGLVRWKVHIMCVSMVHVYKQMKNPVDSKKERIGMV